MRHGLSSLGRFESRALVTLNTVEAALAALVDGTGPRADWPPTHEAFFRGEACLQANTSALFGGSTSDAGRILVTLSTEAAHEPGYLLEIARRGADAVRINCKRCSGALVPLRTERCLFCLMQRASSYRYGRR
jgi:pyruvate kinase